MKSSVFLQSDADPCIFVWDTKKLTVIAVYVNDLIIANKTDAGNAGSEADSTVII